MKMRFSVKKDCCNPGGFVNRIEGKWQKLTVLMRFLQFVYYFGDPITLIDSIFIRNKLIQGDHGNLIVFILATFC